MKLAVKLIDKNDPYKSGHSEKVYKLSELIGLHLKLNQKQQDILKSGSLLHDIGKVLLPGDLWAIPQKVDEEEKREIQKHPLLGAELLKECDFDEEIVNIVKYHHEWWDGRGYCENLAGEEIPLLARIVGLAEAYISMISYDIYSHSLDKEEAIKRIREYRGKQFAPDIVDVFLDLMEEN